MRDRFLWRGSDAAGTSPQWTRLAALISLVVLIAATVGTGVAFAKGGTAKPPTTSTPSTVDTPAPPDVAPPTFVDVNDVHQFDITGFMQSGAVDGSICPTVTDPNLWGGTTTVNGIAVIIPCNSIIQMPAASVTWPELLATPSLANTTPSFELSITGNIVGGKHIAGLVYASQQSLNGASGVITRIDYATGDIWVGGKVGAPDQARVRINDPNGRFGRAQSPDPRFSVDDENPTIHAGTGFPMCVPRTNPGVSDDPECPQKNRPKVNDLTNIGCRNFTQAGVPLPVSGELAPPPAGQVYCTHWVTENPATAAANHANAWKQAPFEVGDNITYSGTLLTDGSGPYISAHTIEANVGIFTQAGTLPVYTAIGEFGVGAADPAATAINGAAQETTDRIFLEAEVSDITSVLDVYLVDKDPVTGVESNRWITPDSMVGGPANKPFLVNTTAPCSDAVRNGPTCTKLTAASTISTTPMGGGITTQFDGPQPGRARIRAIKPPNGIMVTPGRMVRVVARQMCNPYTVNRVTTGAAAEQLANPSLTGQCLERAPGANGLFTGQYEAPVFEFIFPENVSVGDPIVPSNFWSLGFLVNGEGGGVGPLIPSPWNLGGPVAPTIASFTPASGAPGTSVTINGSGLTGASSVKFNGTDAVITSGSTTTLTATVPAGATTGPISVVTPGGTATSVTSFTVTAPAGTPTIASFTPTSGPAGTLVTITGTNLVAATVKFNGTPATVNTTSATTITTTVPPGAGTGSDLGHDLGRYRHERRVVQLTTGRADDRELHAHQRAGERRSHDQRHELWRSYCGPVQRNVGGVRRGLRHADQHERSGRRHDRDDHGDHERRDGNQRRDVHGRRAPDRDDHELHAHHGREQHGRDHHRYRLHGRDRGVVQRQGGEGLHRDLEHNDLGHSGRRHGARRTDHDRDAVGDRDQRDAIRVSGTAGRLREAPGRPKGGRR